MGDETEPDDWRSVIADLREMVAGLRDDLAIERAERQALREANAAKDARIEELERRFAAC